MVKEKIGDEIMVDTFAPFVEVLEQKGANFENILPIFQEAVIEVGEGLKSTKKLVSKIGRSILLGDRSIDTQDLGATSAYLLKFLDDLTQKVI